MRCRLLFTFHHYHQNFAAGFAARFLLLLEVAVDGKLVSSGEGKLSKLKINKISGCHVDTQVELERLR